MKVLEENKLPDSVERSFSLKTEFIDFLDGAVTGVREGRLKGVTTPSNLHCVFVTSFGLVEGTVIRETVTYESLTKENLFTFLVDTALDSKNVALGNAEDKFGNVNVHTPSAGFVLRNVKLTTFAHPNAPITMDDFFLFSDQITGVSLSVNP